MSKPFPILLAEDDEDDRSFFSEVFRHDASVAVVACENGLHLLMKLRQLQGDGNLPAAIVLDQNMPMLSGLETVRQLKADEAFSALPIFYLLHLRR